MSDLQPLESNYLLCLNIKNYRDKNGNLYFNELWLKDLKKHLFYIKNFTLLCIYSDEKLPVDTININKDPILKNIRIVYLPLPNSLIKSLLYLPKTLMTLWRAVGEADIVHSCVAGWPIPMGWLITPIVILRKKFYLIIVESAPWRISAGERSTLQNRIKAYIFEMMARWCVNNTDLAIFTQQEYRDSLLKPHKRGYIIQASWIDEDNIISKEEAISNWNRKISTYPRPLKILFVGRLTIAKGILVLLEAMKILEGERINIHLDILGSGELLEECEKAAHSRIETTKINILGTVPYNSNFFKLLEEYDTIVIPSLSDEQPRIIYDAYSRAIPVIASDTAGLRQCVENGRTGFSITPNDAKALAESIKEASFNLDRLKDMGLNSLDVATGMTHEEMHRKRWEILSGLLS